MRAQINTRRGEWRIIRQQPAWQNAQIRRMGPPPMDLHHVRSSVMWYNLHYKLYGIVLLMSL